jgi:beta-phosphoglucomutase
MVWGASRGPYDAIVLQAVVFDFDGVLVDSEPLHFRTLRASLDAEGVEITREEYLRFYLAHPDRDSIRLALERHGRAKSAEQVERVCEKKAALFEEGLPQVTFFPGAQELVLQLASRVRLGVASGARRSEIEAGLKAGGLRDAFGPIVSAEDVSRGKPHPDPYLLAIERLSTARAPLVASSCVAVEDSPIGVVSARAAAMKVIAVANSYPESELVLAERVVSSLAHLAPIDFERLAG